MRNKKTRFSSSNEFTTPYSLTQNLQGSVTNLDAAVKALNATSDLLKSVNTESLRQAQFTTCEQTHELVSNIDIENARRDVSSEIIPECEHLLKDAQIELDKLKAEEAELSKQVEEQDRTLRDMKRERQLLLQQQHHRSQPATRKRTTSVDRSQLKAKRNKLTQLLAEQNEANAMLLADIGVIKAKNHQLSMPIEHMESSQELEEREKLMMEELTQLEALAKKKQDDIGEKKKAQQHTAVVEMDPTTIQDSIAQYTSHLEFIQKALHDTNRPEFVTTKSILSSCETQCKKYFQALQKEKIYIQMDEKHKQEDAGEEQLELLVKHAFAFTLGKTAARLFKLLYTNHYSLSSEKLLQEFPSSEEERHKLMEVTLHLLAANILKIADGDLMIAK